MLLEDATVSDFCIASQEIQRTLNDSKVADNLNVVKKSEESVSF